MSMRIGRYEVQAELGRGGFGVVYRAYDVQMDRSVAIKVLIAESDPDLLGRFKNEAATTARLKHKNIVTVHDYGEHEGKPYLVMELVEGQNLHRIIATKQASTMLEKVDILFQTAEGLHYAHQGKVIHRDIKPANIMFLPDGTVKVMDFGIARVTSKDGTRRTQQGFLIGTISYMAPEQFRSGADADALTDIFAFGDVCYELLTGVHPFPGTDPGNVMYRITATEPEPVRRLAPDCPDVIEYIVQRALAKDREVRYQSLQDFLLDVEPVLLELRQDRALEIAQEASVLLESGDVQAAQHKVREALELDPRCPPARQIRDSLQQKVQERAIKSKVATFLAEGDALFDQGRFAEAATAFEGALRLEKHNPGAVLRLERTKQALEAGQKAIKLTLEARRAAQQGDLERAYALISEACAADPQSREAAQTAERVRQMIEKRDREVLVKQVLTRIEELRLREDFDQALEALDRLDPEALGEPARSQLRATIEEEQAEAEQRQRIEQFRQDIRQAGELLDAGRLDDAEHIVATLGSAAPDTPAASALELLKDRIAEQRRAEALTEVARGARNLLKSERFEEARASLEAGLHNWGDDSGLRSLLEATEKLQAAHQRALAVAKALETARGLRQEGRLEQALVHVRDAISTHGEDAALADFGRRLEFEYEQQQYAVALGAALEEGGKLLSAGRAADAVAYLEQASASFPHEVSVASLLAAAHKAKAAQDQQQYVQASLEHIASLEKQQQLDIALLAAESGLTHYPDEPVLAGAAARVRERIQHEERQRRLSEHRARIEAALTAADWGPARAALQSADVEFPSEASLEPLRNYLEQQERQAELAKLEAEVRQSLDLNDLDSAEQWLAIGNAHSAEGVWQNLNTELLRRRAYQNRLAEAERLQQSGNLDQAEGMLRQVASEDPPDARAAALLETVIADRKRIERTQAIDRGRAEAQTRASRVDLAGAIQVLQDLCLQFPDDLDLIRERDLMQSRLAKQIEAQRAAEEAARKAAAEKAAQEAAEERKRVERRQAIERGRVEASGRASRSDLAGALQVLQHLCAQFPDEVDLAGERERMQVRLAEQKAAERAALAAAAREAERKEAERKAAERTEAERREAERKETERKAAERAEAERKAAAQAEAARQEVERKAAAERADAERKEAERKAAAQAEAARQEAERKAAAERAEAERKEAERKAAAQAEAARQEAERKAAAGRADAERKEAERKAAAQAEAARQEAERKAAAERADAERKEAERKAAAQAEAARQEAERKAAAKEAARQAEEKKRAERRHAIEQGRAEVKSLAGRSDLTGALQVLQGLCARFPDEIDLLNERDRMQSRVTEQAEKAAQKTARKAAEAEAARRASQVEPIEGEATAKVQRPTFESAPPMQAPRVAPPPMEAAAPPPPVVEIPRPEPERPPAQPPQRDWQDVAAETGRHTVEVEALAATPWFKRPAIVGPIAAVVLILGYFIFKPGAPPPTVDGFAATPVELSFACNAGETPASQKIALSGDFEKVEPSAAWIKAERSATDARTVEVVIHPEELTARSYDGTVVFTIKAKDGAAKPYPVPVHLTIRPEPVTSLLKLVPGKLDFAYRDGDPLPPAKQITVRNAGKAIVVTPQDPSSARWLKTSVSGSTISVQIRPQGLPVQTHNAVLVISSDGSKGSPQRLPVVLTISPGAQIQTGGGGAYRQLRWEGSLGPGEVLTLQGGTASPGSVSGALPAARIEVTKLKSTFEVVSMPTPENGYRMQVRNKGTDTETGLTIFFRER